jgi:hypothetical protein
MSFLEIAQIMEFFMQGWPWVRARQATALGLTSKLGLVPKFFKALIERS